MGGLLPFAVVFLVFLVFIELFLILKSIWEDQRYYMFGFLSLVFIILVVTGIEMTIVITYSQLCHEVRDFFHRNCGICRSCLKLVLSF